MQRVKEYSSRSWFSLHVQGLYIMRLLTHFQWLLDGICTYLRANFHVTNQYDIQYSTVTDIQFYSAFLKCQRSYFSTDSIVSQLFGIVSSVLCKTVNCHCTLMLNFVSDCAFQLTTCIFKTSRRKKSVKGGFIHVQQLNSPSNY